MNPRDFFEELDVVKMSVLDGTKNLERASLCHQKFEVSSLMGQFLDRRHLSTPPFTSQ